MDDTRIDSSRSEVPLGAEPAEPSDAEFVERLHRGDRSAFRPLVERYESAVYGLCRRLLGGSDAEAEDLSQETFLRAFHRLGQLDDRRRFGPWLFQVARSLCRDRVRHLVAERRALERGVDLEGWQSVDAPPDDELSTVLASIPERERRALELKYFEGLAYRDIAAELGLSFSRVDHLIRQARARLAGRIEARRQRERSLQHPETAPRALR